MATKILSSQQFVGGAGISGLSAATANGQPVVYEQLTALTGGVVYQGAWNASTNSPTIPAASSGNKGYYYVVSVAGTTTVDGINDWEPGDWIVSNGTAWEKIDNTEPSASTTVAGNVRLATSAETIAGSSSSIAITPAGLAAYTGFTKKFSQTIGDGTSTSIAVTHSLGTKDVAVSLREVSSDAGVMTDWVATSTTVVTFSFSTAPTSSQYRVTIIG
jgi:hypothetical protein